jgi:hypothetical protein
MVNGREFSNVLSELVMGVGDGRDTGISPSLDLWNW